MKGGITDIFFDLDHTLWDFERNSAITFRHILEEEKIQVSANAFLETYVPINHYYWKLFREEKITKESMRYIRLKKTFDQLQYNISDEMIDKISYLYIAKLSDQKYLFKNALDILKYLRPKYKLHIITDGFEAIQLKKIKRSGIDYFFEHIITADKVGAKKPSPFIFKYALEKAGISAKQAVMIGDTFEADVQGAIRIGMEAIHFNSNNEAYHDDAPIIKDLIRIKEYL